jgi:hypothetical protein
MAPNFRRYDYDDSSAHSETLAGEIITVAEELLHDSREQDSKNSMRGVYVPKSERSLKERLEALIERERLDHPDLVQDMIEAVAHAHGLQLCQLQSSSSNFDLCRCRIAAARTAVLSAGAPVFQVARVLQKDRSLVQQWIDSADV